MDKITEYAGFDNLSCVTYFKKRKYKKRKHKISKPAIDLASLATDAIEYAKRMGLPRIV